MLEIDRGEKVLSKLSLALVRFFSPQRRGLIRLQGHCAVLQTGSGGSRHRITRSCDDGTFDIPN